MNINGHKRTRTDANGRKKAPKQKSGKETKEKSLKSYEGGVLYTISQVAAVLQCNRKTVSKLIETGELKAADLPAGKRIKGEWIDDLIKNRIISYKE